MTRDKVTRESFSEIIRDVPDWQSCLTEFQKEVVQKWYIEGESLNQISKELRVSHRTIQRQIRGDNQFGANGAIRKIAKYKGDLIKKEQESKHEGDI